MGIFLKGIFNIISDGGIIPKSPTEKIVEKAVQSLTKKAVKNITSNFSTSENRNAAEYGDVIGVERRAYKHFGIYISDFGIIHYASRTGDLGEDICIHETTLDKFLDGATSYFVCKFPKIYGNPSEIDIESLASSLYSKDKFYDLFYFFKRHNYKLYSPEETVERARSRIGEGEYNLITNNCEHFALWCKTGISESHQVNNLLDIILKEYIYL